MRKQKIFGINFVRFECAESCGDKIGLAKLHKILNYYGPASVGVGKQNGKIQKPNPKEINKT